MKSAVLTGTLVAVLMAASSAVASDPIVLPSGQEGCVSPSGDTCTFSPTRTGGIAPEGDAWTLTVVIPAPAGDPRDTNLDGKLRYVFTPANAPATGCGFFGAGSTVTTNAGANSGLAAGNPFPGASDAAIGSANDCAGGIVGAGNTSYTPAD